MVPGESRERKARCTVGPAAKPLLFPQARREEAGAPPVKQNAPFCRAEKHIHIRKNAIRHTKPKVERKKAYSDKLIDCRLKRKRPKNGHDKRESNHLRFSFRGVQEVLRCNTPPSKAYLSYVKMEDQQFSRQRAFQRYSAISSTQMIKYICRPVYDHKRYETVITVSNSCSCPKDLRDANISENEPVQAK